MQLQLQELNVLMNAVSNLLLIHFIFVYIFNGYFKIIQDNPHLLKVYEILEDDGRYYIISELMHGGELYDRILAMKKFTEKDVANICIQILRGLNYMHKKNIAHRDIKPENILMASKDVENIELKITDFGFAKCYDP